MEGGKVTKVDLSLTGRVCVCAVGEVVYAAITNSLFTISKDNVQMGGWTCDLESLAAGAKSFYLGDVDGVVWEQEGKSKKELFRVDNAIVDLDVVGGIVAAGTEDPRPVVYTEGKTVRMEEPHKKAVMSVALSRNGAYLASIGFEGRVHVYDCKSGARLARAQISKPRPDDAPEKLRAAWDLSSTYLLVPGDRLLRKLAVSDWQLTDMTLSTAAGIVALRWTDSEDFVAGFSGDGTVFVWNVSSQVQLAEVRSESRVSDLAITPRDIVFATSDGVVNYWNRGVEALKDDEADQLQEADEPVSEDEPTNYFDACLGALPQKPISALSDDIDGKVLHRGMLGTIVAKEYEGTPVIEIRLILEKNSKSIAFRNSHDFSLADMSESGAVLAGQSHFLLFRSLTKENSSWMVELPPSETVDVVAMGLSWCASCSSSLALRLFSVQGGVQLYSLSMQSPVVAMATHGDSLGIVLLDGPPTLGVQRLHLETRALDQLTESANIPVSHAEVAVSPGEELVWFGFSDVGVPCTCDSAGVTRVYWQKAALWVPILSVSDFTVIGVTDADVYGLEDGNIVVKPYEAAFCSTTTSKSESSYFLQKLLFDQNSSPEAEIELEKQLIGLVREAAISGEEEKVFAYFDMMRRRKTKQVTIKLLMDMQMFQLAPRLSDRLNATGAIPPSVGKAEERPRAEVTVKQPLTEKPQQDTVDPGNPFLKKAETKADIFTSLSEVAKRKAEPLQAPTKKRKT